MSRAGVNAAGRSTGLPLAATGFATYEGLFYPLTAVETRALVHDALAEDQADSDITTIATIVTERHSSASLVARRPGIVCGVPLAIETFRQRDPNAVIRQDIQDGQGVERGGVILFLNSTARGLLSAERVALNFMQRLSGIATLTAHYVDAVSGTHARIHDTRKTTPGWRRLEKYAVRCGGAMNHRNDLAHAVLIKDNHIAVL